MNRIVRTVTALALPIMFAWVALAGNPAFAQTQVQGAKAEIKSAQGQVVGTALVLPSASGVKLEVSVQGFTAAAVGEHGIHVHTTGKCEADAFTTAGGHFNPGSKKHGLNSPEGHHAGDLRNINFDGTGNATYEAIVEGISLDAGATSLLDADGSAVVIHAGPDDYATDPAGNSGARIACGEFAAYAVATAGMPQTGTSFDTTLLLMFGLFAAFALVLVGHRLAAARK